MESDAKTVPGYTITIEHDEDPTSPNEWGNTDAFLVGYDSRDFWVFRAGYELPKIRAALCGQYEDGSEYNGECSDLLKEYRLYEVDAYVHSGVAIRLGEEMKKCSHDEAYGVRDPFGIVFVSRKDYKTDTEARTIAKAIIHEWTDYLDGDVYISTVIDPEGNIKYSCGGFYGDDGRKQALAEGIAVARAAKLKRDADRERVALRASSADVEIYDTGADGPIDRYTIIDTATGSAYGMSDDPKSPQGFNQYLGDPAKLDRGALGKKRTYNTLPLPVREAIIDRLIG